MGRGSNAEVLIADTSPTADPSSLRRRIRIAANGTPSRLTLSIGVVSFPLSRSRRIPATDVLNELIDLASTAMCAARKAGGDTVRYEITPQLGTNERNHDAR